MINQSSLFVLTYFRNLSCYCKFPLLKLVLTVMYVPGMVSVPNVMSFYAKDLNHKELK